MYNVTLLNTSIITAHGTYKYEPISLERAQEIVNLANDVQSAIGHESTAAILSDLLERPVAVNRINYVQQVDDVAVVFKLKTRAPEGVILNRKEIEAIGYEFGLLKRVLN